MTVLIVLDPPAYEPPVLTWTCWRGITVVGGIVCTVVGGRVGTVGAGCVAGGEPAGWASVVLGGGVVDAGVVTGALATPAAELAATCAVDAVWLTKNA
jgi:hypothetical protein